MVHFDTACQQLIEVSQRLHASGWAPATSGNFSVRTGPDRFAITQSGRDKSRLEPGDVMEVGLDAGPLTPGQPSAETGLHLQLYRREPHIGAVLHSHSLNAVLVSKHCVPANEHCLTLAGLELLKAFAGIDSHEVEIVVPVFDNNQDIGALAATVDRAGTGVAFSMYPTSIEQLMAIADAGQIMPPKSTWFEPKLRSGLVVHLI